MPLSYPKYRPTDKEDFDRGSCPLKANKVDPYCNGRNCAWFDDKNNQCAKSKKTCTHLKDSKCIRGWCLI